jgi:hypothetical protein
MKKFTNLSNIEEVKISKNIDVKTQIKNFISENIHFEYEKDPENESFELNENAMVDMVMDYINEMTEVNKNNILNMLENKSLTERVVLIQELIKVAENELKQDNNIIRPSELFTSDDYLINEGFIQLNSLTKLPKENFSEYLSSNDISNYFENKNSIKIDNNWLITFEYNKEKYLDYKEFVKENKEFIKDFITSLSQTIDAKNLKLDKNLISILS